MARRENAAERAERLVWQEITANGQWLGEWKQVRVSDLISTLKEHHRVPRTRTKKTLLNILKHHHDRARAVRTAERMVTWGQTKRQGEQKYLRLSNGGWVSHLRVHGSLLQN